MRLITGVKINCDCNFSGQQRSAILKQIINEKSKKNFKI